MEQAQSQEHRFPTGLTLTTFPRPSEGFDPLTANDDELISFGYPRRPVWDEAALERWISIMREPMRIIEPTFSLTHGIKHGPQQGTAEVSETSFSSNNWSGVVVDAPTGRSMRWIQGEWTVPEVYPIANDNKWSRTSSWIGIDGSGSSDVLQAGLTCGVIQNSNGTFREYYTWMEWFPENEIKIPNLFVKPGDVVALLICATSLRHGALFYYNRTTKTALSFGVDPPSGTTLSGNCAEWIVERPTVDGTLARLADYRACTFSDCTTGTAVTPGGQTLRASSGNTFDMTDGTTTISTGAIDSATSAKCAFV